MNEKREKRKRIFKILFTAFTCIWLFLIEIIAPRVMPLAGNIYNKFDLSQSRFLQMAQYYITIPHGIYLLVIGSIVIFLTIIHRSSKKIWPSVTANSIVIFLSILYFYISAFIIALPLMERSIKVIDKHVSEQGNVTVPQTPGR
jgi:hypothetical protein